MSKCVSNNIMDYGLMVDSDVMIDSDSINSLGMYFCDEKNRNYEEAVKCFSKAALQGNLHGLFNLARCYYEGFGIPQDYICAFKLFNYLFDKGDSSALIALGKCYLFGHGTQKNYYVALNFFQKADRLNLLNEKYKFYYESVLLLMLKN